MALRNTTLTQHLVNVTHDKMLKSLIDDLSRHVPIYRNGHFRKMRWQFCKLHFGKLKMQQRTFNHV